MVCFIDSIFKILVSQVNIPMHCTFWTLCYEIMIEGPHLLITWVSAFLISFATLVMVSPRAKVLSNSIWQIIGVATEVECKLYVRSLGSINPDTMVSTIHTYVMQ